MDYVDKEIRLNFIPVEFSNNEFSGGILPYENKDQLRDLREKYRESHILQRSGNEIQCIPLKEGEEPLGTRKTFNTERDFGLARKLIHDSLLRLFQSRNQELAGLYPTIKVVLRKEDIFPGILGESDGEYPLFLYPQYEIESRLIIPHRGKIQKGIVLNFSTRYGFNATVKELMDKGVDVAGRYVVADRSENNKQLASSSRFKRKLIGKIKEIDGDTLYLTDFSERDNVDAGKFFLEPRLENFNHCISSLYPTNHEAIQQSIKKKTYEITGAKPQHERLMKIVGWLRQYQPLKCAGDLSFNVSDAIFAPQSGRDAGTYRMMNNPDCMLRPGGSITAKWPIDRHLEEKGPFDTESFPNKVPRIAVIFPARFKGEVEIFVRQFRDGVSNNSGSPSKFVPYSQGFVRKYRLTGCNIDLFSLDGDENAAAYRQKALEVLGKDSRYNLAIVVAKEEFHRLRGDKNPYLVMKSVFMSQGIPIQSVEIETIRNASRVYVLNNMAVACYAKLGGMPWVLSSSQGLTHELVFGIGSSQKRDGRLAESERVIGITTVFSGDGNYLLSNVSKEVPYEEYQNSLLNALKDTLDQIKKRYAWQPGDKVRMIFHQTFKKFRYVEAAAVKDFVSNISDLDVEYSFVHLNRRHSWKIFDLNSKGSNYWIDGQSFKKGEYAPWRGCCVPLGPKAALLGLTGPPQLKTNLQGAPLPILISLHNESTFTSLDYIVTQIYKLTFMSWRSFFPSTMPVTISYSDLIAELLGQLRDIPNWNPDMLATKLRESGWFL